MVVADVLDVVAFVRLDLDVEDGKRLGRDPVEPVEYEDLEARGDRRRGRQAGHVELPESPDLLVGLELPHLRHVGRSAIGQGVVRVKMGRRVVLIRLVRCDGELVALDDPDKPARDRWLR